MCFNPAAGIDEGLHPRRNIVIATIGRISGALPGIEGTLEVGHHREVTTIGRTDTGNTV